MPAEQPAAYLDANVFLAYVSREQGRTKVVRELLKHGDEGQRRLFTSTLSIVEVAFGAQEKEGRALRPETEDQIETLWSESGRPVVLVEPTASIMRKARGLIREEMVAGRRLTAADAVHLASAQAAGAKVFFTYEEAGRRSTWAELTGLDVTEPFVNQEPML